MPNSSFVWRLTAFVRLGFTNFCCLHVRMLLVCVVFSVRTICFQTATDKSAISACVWRWFDCHVAFNKMRRNISVQRMCASKWASERASAGDIISHRHGIFLPTCDFLCQGTCVTMDRFAYAFFVLYNHIYNWRVYCVYTDSHWMHCEATLSFVDCRRQMTIQYRRETIVKIWRWFCCIYLLLCLPFFFLASP